MRFVPETVDGLLELPPLSLDVAIGSYRARPQPMQKHIQILIREVSSIRERRGNFIAHSVRILPRRRASSQPQVTQPMSSRTLVQLATTLPDALPAQHHL
jgi:hypothetical protein